MVVNDFFQEGVGVRRGMIAVVLSLAVAVTVLAQSPFQGGGYPTPILGYPILESAMGGDTDQVRILLDKGVDPNTQDPYGFSPLYLAASSGRVEIVKMLLAKGAKPDGPSPAACNRHTWPSSDPRGSS
jgi:hypothetical protein